MLSLPETGSPVNTAAPLHPDFLKPSVRRTFDVIASLAAKTGACHACRRWLAARCGVSKPTLDRHIVALVGFGLLRQSRRSGMKSLLFICPCPEKKIDSTRSGRDDGHNTGSDRDVSRESRQTPRPRKRVATLTPPVDVEEPEGSFPEDSPITQIETPAAAGYAPSEPSAPSGVSAQSAPTAPSARSVQSEPSEDPGEFPADARADLVATLYADEETPTVSTEAVDASTPVADDAGEMQAVVGAESSIAPTIDREGDNRVSHGLRQDSIPDAPPPEQYKSSSTVKPPPHDGPDAALLHRLADLGVTPTTAARMVNEDAEEVRRQLAAPGLQTARNKARWIVAAVRDRYRQEEVPPQQRNEPSAHDSGRPMNVYRAPGGVPVNLEWTEVVPDAAVSGLFRRPAPDVPRSFAAFG